MIEDGLVSQINPRNRLVMLLSVPSLCLGAYNFRLPYKNCKLQRKEADRRMKHPKFYGLRLNPFLAVVQEIGLQGSGFSSPKRSRPSDFLHIKGQDPEGSSESESNCLCLAIPHRQGVCYSSFVSTLRGVHHHHRHYCQPKYYNSIEVRLHFLSTPPSSLFPMATTILYPQ